MGDIYNDGIIGDNWTVRNVVTGGGTIHDEGMTTLDVALAELLEAIAVYEGPRETKAQMQAEADRVADALEDASPDRAATLTRLVGIAALAGSTGTVATAVTNVIHALS